MSFDWSHFLGLAHHLAGIPGIRPDQEAAKRSAISRAYYSVFCRARNHLRDIDQVAFPSAPFNVHAFVVQQFGSSGDMARRKIGADLDRLRSNRNKADYDDTVTMLNRLTSVSIAMASQVASSLSCL